MQKRKIRNDDDCSTATAIRLNCRSLSLEITNLASRSVIDETISSLLSLCYRKKIAG